MPTTFPPSVRGVPPEAAKITWPLACEVKTTASIAERVKARVAVRIISGLLGAADLVAWSVCARSEYRGFAPEPYDSWACVGSKVIRRAWRGTRPCDGLAAGGDKSATHFPRPAVAALFRRSRLYSRP